MRPTNHLCSIYPISATLIEGSDAEAMLQRFPNGGSHDGTNIVFAGVPENPTGAVYLPELEEGEEEMLIGFAGKHLVNPDNVNGLIGTKSQLNMLYRSPIYILFAGLLDDKQDYIDLTLSTLGMPLDSSLELDVLKQGVRDAIVASLA